ncbi:MAG: UvrD-helicase domain-containing protein, partial [Gammaproteobacteria bacterium SHHR-1]
MTLAPLTVIPAGAGSGKTHSLQEQLGTWVVDGQVQPERIVAVTFTEAAAAELRERIRAKLLALGRLDDAVRLDNAYISTIHGFGQRLLTEFAFEGGLSPRLRLLTDDEQSILIRRALARTTKVDPIMANLKGYGYSYDFNRDTTAEDAFRDDLLGFVNLLRALGAPQSGVDYAAAARDWIHQRYGQTANAKRLTTTLHKAVMALLKDFPNSLADDFGTSKSAINDLRANYDALKRASIRDDLDQDWGLWKDLSALRQTKRGCPLPSGYDERAQAVMDAAAQIATHPGPRDRAVAFVETMLAASVELLGHYETAKKEAGLIDFNDMIALAGRLLKQTPDVLHTLAGRIDCLVVDDFQDTNPLQFDLLWQLKEAGIPTIIVGDLKQAIMGFQGADPRLFAAIQAAYPKVCTPLVNNWRSQPKLMSIINALGTRLFGDQYQTLEPKGSPSPLPPLDILFFADSAKKDQHAIRAHFVAQRIQTLLEDNKLRVIDRRTKQKRPLAGRDIAVLCPTHDLLRTYAEQLRQSGIKVRLQQDGWYEDRLVEILLQALAYIANPKDRHAALYLSVTELGNLSLADALGQLIETGRIVDPLLAKLDDLADDTSEQTIYALVAALFDHLELFD